MNEKDLILALIKDDLLYHKWIHNFRDIGINADAYNLDLSNTIFKVMGIHRSAADTTFDTYLELVEKAKHFAHDNSFEFDRHATDLYDYLDSLRERKPYVWDNMNEARFNELMRKLIKIDAVNYRNFKDLERIGVDHYSDLFPIMEIVFEFMGVEVLPDGEVDVITSGYIEKLQYVLGYRLKPDHQVEALADKLFDYIASHQKRQELPPQTPEA